MSRIPPTSCRSIDVFSDSDWAACKASRKSISSTVVLVGGFLITATARTQSVISQSSGEAEYIAGAASASEGLYVRELFRSCGIEMKLLIHIDSTSAIGTASRRGLTRIRHLDVRFLWLQSACAEKRLELRKCPGEENCADANTKAACLILALSTAGHGWV